MIADEVLTGFGRTGRMFACEHAAVTPDIICLSKALTGGYLPLGATVATEPVYDAFLSDDRTRTFFHGHSFTANPLACAVAIASLEPLRTRPTCSARSGRSSAGCASGSSRCARCRSRRRRPRASAASASSSWWRTVRRNPRAAIWIDLGPRLTQAFLDRGLLLRPLGNVLYFMPPYVITESETAWAIEQMRDVLASVRMT